MMHDPVSDGLVKMKNAEDAGKKEVEVPYSKLMVSILSLLKDRGYIADFEVRGAAKKLIVVKLAGRLNNCKAIKPRFVVKKDEYSKWEKRYLPGQNLGLLVVSTSKGLMDHYSARREGIGGRLIAFVY